MNKETIRIFLHWLEDASDEALLARAALIQGSLPDVSTRDGRADLRLALRLIDEERFARFELGQILSK